MSKKRCIISFIVLSAVLLSEALINLVMGSAGISAREVFAAFTGQGDHAMAGSIIFQIRIPRIAAAMILGGGLALSGYMLQTFFNNPIVGPFVLGVSSGAKLMVALLMIFLLGMGRNISAAGMVTAAFVGALFVMGFVLLISLKVRNMGTLVVCGIMIGYICSAITDFVITFADDSDIVNLHNWSMGSLSGMDLQDVRIMAVIILFCLVFAFFCAKPMGAYRLGETYAASMGVNIRLLRIVLILLSSLLAATVTAFAGPISFVGIAVPHLVGGILGSSEPKVMIPGVFLGGAAVTLLCDGIARTLFAPTEVSISSVTAVMLVPVVIFIMLRRKNDR